MAADLDDLSYWLEHIHREMDITFVSRSYLRRRKKCWQRESRRLVMQLNLRKKQVRNLARKKLQLRKIQLLTLRRLHVE